MRVVATYSSRLRNLLTVEDWLAIKNAGVGEVRFSRGFENTFIAKVDTGDHRHGEGSARTPRKAFNAAMEQIVEAAA
jgi:hypothetical protein